MEKKNNTILKSFIGCILAILLLASIAFMYDRIFNFEKQVNIEKYIGDGSVKSIDYNSEVICEEGNVVEKYTGARVQNIYSCLKLIDGKCSGDGKICLIKNTIRVRKR